MKRFRRALCALLAALTLCTLGPQPSAAADTVYFTAANEILLDLNDETMPFWSGGMIFVPLTDTFRTELGVIYSLSRAQQMVVLYKGRRVMACDLAANTIYDATSNEVYTGWAIVRGSTVFVPVGTFTRFFDLSYTYTKISYGYLIRVKSDAAQLSDAIFLDAANSLMTTRYQQYVRAHTPPEEVKPEPQTDPTPTPAPLPSGPTGSEPNTPLPPQRRTVSLAVEARTEEDAAPLLNTLTAASVTFLFTADAARQQGALVRRIVSSGHALGISVNGAQDAAATLAEIDAANEALWTAARYKTRLVYAADAAAETARTVEEAGYCLISFSGSYNSARSTAARLSAAIVALADAHGGRCSVLLGADEGLRGKLGTLLGDLRAENCTMTRMTELAH